MNGMNGNGLEMRLEGGDDPSEYRVLLLARDVQLPSWLVIGQKYDRSLMLGEDDARAHVVRSNEDNL